MEPRAVALFSLALVGFLEQRLCLGNEREIKCKAQSASEPPSEWERPHSRTPSDLSSLKVELISAGDHQHPLLNISWNLSPDGSIQELIATMICIQSPWEYVCFRCNYSKRFKSEVVQGKPWLFYYAEHPASPETSYLFTAFNIPPPNIGEDLPEQALQLKTPGCENNLMKNLKYCQDDVDVLWKPNISLCLINNNVMEINFTTHEQSSRYAVYLVNNASKQDIDTTTIPWSNNSRVTVRFEGSYPETLYVEIDPRFPSCLNDCTQHRKFLNCFITRASQEFVPFPLISETRQLTWMFVALSLVVLGLMLGAPLFIKRANARMWALPLVAEWMPPVSVLLIYSLDDDPRQKPVVLSFAEFLQSVCGAEVMVDMWQTRKVAQMGPLAWLASCKETADKVVVLCSGGTGARWKASCREPDSVLTPPGPGAGAEREELFTAAVNLLCHELQDPRAARKVVVVYLADLGSAEDVPGVFSPCAKYCLDKDIEAFYRDLYDLPPRRDGESSALLQHKQLLYRQTMSRALSQFTACPTPTPPLSRPNCQRRLCCRSLDTSRLSDVIACESMRAEELRAIRGRNASDSWKKCERFMRKGGGQPGRKPELVERRRGNGVVGLEE
ncbi:interleukin-17 receptor B [Callorhinchus milii]|nr:interleukin-17 receptor B [Callorhinchus milii]